MDLNKENIRKIKELIVFTALILIGLWKYTLVLDILKFILGILMPFLIGGAIAFVPAFFIAQARPTALPEATAASYSSFTASSVSTRPVELSTI